MLLHQVLRVLPSAFFDAASSSGSPGRADHSSACAAANVPSTNTCTSSWNWRDAPRNAS
jgi:hypothetical protein